MFLEIGEKVTKLLNGKDGKLRAAKYKLWGQKER